MEMSNSVRNRMRHETMCIENLGSGSNNGPAILADVPVRTIRSVISTNNSVTAKTDEEIFELSKLNENVIVNGNPQNESLYRVRFTGSFELSNFCYAIIKQNCRCVVSQDNNKMYVTTAKFRTMNALSGLISRLAENIILRIEIFRYDLDGSIHLINDTTAYDEIIPFIQEDYRCRIKGRVIDSLNYEAKNVLSDDVERIIAPLRQEIYEKNEEIKRLKEENTKLKEFVDRIQTAVRELD